MEVRNELNKYANGVLWKTFKARLYFAVHKGLSERNWLNVIGVCCCLGLISKRDQF